VWPIATDICLLVTTMNHAKMAQLIIMLFFDYRCQWTQGIMYDTGYGSPTDTGNFEKDDVRNSLTMSTDIPTGQLLKQSDVTLNVHHKISTPL